MKTRCDETNAWRHSRNGLPCSVPTSHKQLLTASQRK